MPQNQLGDSVKKVAILLGASEFPRSPNLKGNASFSRSAVAFKEYAMAAQGLGISSESVLDLFDSGERLDEQDQHIVDFLQSKATATDLLIFYVGHAGFLFDREYFLALRSTIRGREPTTGFRIKALAYTIDLHFANKRVYLILDCCFAGEAVDDFQLEGSSAVSKLIETQSREALRSSGTSLLVASSKDEPAVAPSGAQYTMFSECFLDVLQTGIQGAGAVLTLTEVGDAVETRLKERFGQKAVRPEVHSPRQKGADIAKRIPLFPNHAFVAPEPAKLPGYILSALGSPFLDARRDAVKELGKCLKSDMVDLAPLARQCLQELADNDDSLSVRNLASKILTESPSPAPGSAVSASSTEQQTIARAADTVTDVPDAQPDTSPREVPPQRQAPQQSSRSSDQRGSAKQRRRPPEPEKPPIYRTEAQPSETEKPPTFQTNDLFGQRERPHKKLGDILWRAVAIGVIGGLIAFGMSQIGWMEFDDRIFRAYAADAMLVYLVVCLLHRWWPIALWPAATVTSCLFISAVREVARRSYGPEVALDELASADMWAEALQYAVSHAHIWIYSVFIVCLSILTERLRARFNDASSATRAR